MQHWAIGVGAALAAWLGLSCLGLSGLAQAATPCAALTAQVLPHAAVTAAADTPAGQITACKIEVTARPSADSDIRIEVWIPEGGAWNGRYVQFGNGGFAGQIASKRLEVVAALGYAVAMTDDGHQTSEGSDARWAVGHPQKVIDFGWRALKETTEAAKALIRTYQGGPAKYAYFQGCSDGGREALMEAQRFPDDFDGIIAGAPAYNMTGLLTLAANDMQSLMQPQAFLDADALKVLETGALAACGGGKYVADPASCRFDPHDLACPRGQANTDCLTPGQVAAAETIYAGLPGKFAYPGHSPGAEAEPRAWSAWITGPSPDQLHQALSFKFSTGFWGGFVFGKPDYDILGLDVDNAPKRAEAVAKIVNSTDPDLGRFRKRGGKLIQYHGWNDPAIPAAGSVVYYEQVEKKLGAVDPFYRLYLIPGMLHCGGGPGPSNVAWLDVLRAWVEQNQAPEGLVATGPGNAAQPLCPFPAKASFAEDNSPRKAVCNRPSGASAPG
jgi:Tannase and feruloyl esterase